MADGDLPADTLVGRWWQDETAEIDVLGLATGGPVLVGECRWQARPASTRDLADLRRRAAAIPGLSEATIYALWTRGGGSPALERHPDARAFTPADILGEG